MKKQLSPDVTVRRWPGGAIVYGFDAIQALTWSELLNLISWTIEQSDSPDAQGDFAEWVVSGLVNGEIDVKTAERAIRAHDACSADEAIGEWVKAGSKHLSYDECAERAPSEDAERLGFEEWRKIYGGLK
jgi:hypothetical protein